MLSEAEKRKYRCCFTGHRPGKLKQLEAEVKNWLRQQIMQAVADGYTTFITGMAMGVDIWAGQIVTELRETDPRLHLIAAVPWSGFPARWHDEWKAQYNDLLNKADIVRNIQTHYSSAVFQLRNEWMVDHSSRLIAFYNGESGGTRNTIKYAQKVGNIEIVVGGTDKATIEGESGNEHP